MKKLILITALVLSLILILFLGLNFSDRFNNFVFAEIINPFNPLQVKNSQLMKNETYSQDYWKDPRGLFPVFAFNVPDSTKDFTASLRIMEEGGINIVINTNRSWITNAQKVKKAFNKLGNSNLRWLTVMKQIHILKNISMILMIGMFTAGTSGMNREVIENFAHLLI